MSDWVTAGLMTVLVVALGVIGWLVARKADADRARELQKAALDSAKERGAELEREMAEKLRANPTKANFDEFRAAVEKRRRR